MQPTIVRGRRSLVRHSQGKYLLYTVETVYMESDEYLQPCRLVKYFVEYQFRIDVDETVWSLANNRGTSERD